MKEFVHRTRMIPLPAKVNMYFSKNQGEKSITGKSVSQKSNVDFLYGPCPCQLCINFK